MFIFSSHRLASHIKTIILIFTILFVSFNSSNHAHADELITTPEIKFDALTIQDGLSQSYVFDIVEDQGIVIFILDFQRIESATNTGSSLDQMIHCTA